MDIHLRQRVLVRLVTLLWLGLAGCGTLREPVPPSWPECLSLLADRCELDLSTASVPVRVLVDTGFDGDLLISPALARRIGTSESRDVTLSMIATGSDDFGSGSMLQVPSLSVKIAPWLSRSPGIDAILGLSPLRRDGLRVVHAPQRGTRVVPPAATSTARMTRIPLTYGPITWWQQSPTFVQLEALRDWAVAMGHDPAALESAMLTSSRGFTYRLPRKVESSLPMTLAWIEGGLCLLVIDTGTDAEVVLWRSPVALAGATRPLPPERGPNAIDLSYGGQVSIQFESGETANVHLCIAPSPRGTSGADGLIGAMLLNLTCWVLDPTEPSWYFEPRRLTPLPSAP
jgi:hypothetical protein